MVLEQHDLAPDGSFAVVTRRVVDGERYTSSLWLVPVAAGDGGPGGRPRRLTSGRFRDTRPAISPDGRRVAFVRRVAADVDATRSLRILDLASGRSVRVKTGDLSVEGPAWSPDGRRLAFTAETGPQRFIVGPVPDDDQEPRARRITTLDYRYDEEGYLDRRSQVHVVAAKAGAKPRRLTHVPGGVSGIAWRPDGRAIAYVADPRDDADLHPRTSIWAVTPDGGGGVGPGGDFDGTGEILALAGPVRAPAYSPDGRWIAGIGVDDADHFDDLSPTLFVGPSDGSSPAVPLAPDLDRPVGNWADTDLTGWMLDGRPVPRGTARPPSSRSSRTVAARTRGASVRSLVAFRSRWSAQRSPIFTIIILRACCTSRRVTMNFIGRGPFYVIIPSIVSQ